MARDELEGGKETENGGREETKGRDGGEREGRGSGGFVHVEAAAM